MTLEKIDMTDPWTKGYDMGFNDGRLTGIIIGIILTLVLIGLYKWFMIYYRQGIAETISSKMKKQ